MNDMTAGCAHAGFIGVKSPAIRKWSHLGLNQGLPDYESGALTN